ncbi:hypothetical protein [Synechocystis salina]|uniref:hypothetical protein n=1 Tax=Synechocystis salina TaxID=945780 RepID=UPI001D155CA8|nr:hypothetical protein [Synechocystis salina]
MPQPKPVRLYPTVSAILLANGRSGKSPPEMRASPTAIAKSMHRNWYLGSQGHF